MRVLLLAVMIAVFASSAAQANTSLKGVTPVLVEKVLEIQKACGSKVVSTIDRRPNKSNHPKGKAVDMVGNPSCIYAQLKGWKGGYSTDYGRVKHVHISYNPGGQEWGLKFAHGYGKHRQHQVRLASGSTEELNRKH